jgi:hypothetical protein
MDCCFAAALHIIVLLMEDRSSSFANEGVAEKLTFCLKVAAIFLRKLNDL